MKLNAITYTEHPEEGAVPATIQVTLTARELVYLARITGAQNGSQAAIVMDGGQVENRAVYACLSGVANSHFDAGLDDWARMLSR
jgi:hypothetical protein